MAALQQIRMMIAGAQKCGTTSLFRDLAQHRQIQVHRQAEMSFFVNDAEFELGYEHAWQKYFGGRSFPGRQLVAKHVLLMYSPPAVRRLLEHNPEVAIVLALRNPVDRAYSSYWYARRKGWEGIESFDEALAREPARLAEGWHRWRHNAYLHGGRYVEFVAGLLQLAGSARLRVLTMEELRRERAAVCRSLFELLGVDATFEPRAARVHNPAATARSPRIASSVQRLASSRHPLREALRRVVPPALSNRVRRAINRWNEVEFTPPPMRPELRRELLEHYRPYNERLAELLGRDFGDWNE